MRLTPATGRSLPVTPNALDAVARAVHNIARLGGDYAAPCRRARCRVIRQRLATRMGRAAALRYLDDLRRRLTAMAQAAARRQAADQQRRAGYTTGISPWAAGCLASDAQLARYDDQRLGAARARLSRPRS